jgi:ActR/RegA family two-component response regulator
MNEKPRMLIVGDDAGLWRALSLILTRKGSEVVTGEDRTRAVDEAKQGPT